MTARETALVFLDTETTGLRLDDDIWEFAAIRREADGSQSEHHYFIDHSTEKCKDLPESFREDHVARFPAIHARGADSVLSRLEFAHAVIKLTKDRPHIVGAVPNFDTERLALLLQEHGARPAWHYHLIDVENLAVGWLAAKGIETLLPWKSDDLSELVGVKPPGEGERHTAMGDARWAMRLYDAIVGGAR